MGKPTKKKVLKFLRSQENILMLSIIGSVILAFCVVVPIRSANPSKRTIELIRFPGDLFFSLLKMCILPVVFCSILSGVTCMDIKTSRKLGIISLIYYLSTTFLASIIGCTLVTIIKPGKYGVKKSSAKPVTENQVSPDDAILDLFRNLFPDNIVKSMTTQIKTLTRNATVVIDNETAVEMQRFQSNVDSTNYLGIIFFCIFFGLVLMTFEDRAKPIIRMINLFNDISMRMMMTVIVLTPVGIFFLLVATLANFKNMESIIGGVGMYIATLLLGLTSLCIILYPALYIIVVRKNPLRVIAKTVKATAYAFMVSSSSATLPLTLMCCEENLGVRKAVTRFMLPIGALVNMDGTSIHQGAAALFIAQLNGIDQSFGQKLLVCMMGALSSIACSTTPGAGIIALLVVLTTAGLPTDDITIFFMTDWLMSRFRTATNILGDSFATTIVEKLCEKDFEDLEQTKPDQLQNGDALRDDLLKEDVALSEMNHQQEV